MVLQFARVPDINDYENVTCCPLLLTAACVVGAPTSDATPAFTVQI